VAVELVLQMLAGAQLQVLEQGKDKDNQLVVQDLHQLMERDKGLLQLEMEMPLEMEQVKEQELLLVVQELLQVKVLAQDKHKQTQLVYQERTDKELVLARPTQQLSPTMRLNRNTIIAKVYAGALVTAMVSQATTHQIQWWLPQVHRCHHHQAQVQAPQVHQAKELDQGLLSHQETTHQQLHQDKEREVLMPHQLEEMEELQAPPQLAQPPL